MKKLIYISVVLSVLCSCEVDVTDKFRDQQNLFVVSGQVVAGEAPRINLSRTITMAEVDTLLYLNEAQLEIGKNDHTFVLDPIGGGFYLNEDLVPQPGDILSLECSGEGLPQASISTTVPEYPQVTDLQFQVDDAFDFTLELSIEDPASTLDYYTFYIMGWTMEIVHHHDRDSGEDWVDTSNIFMAYDLRIIDPVMEYTGGPRQFNFYDLSEPWGQYFHFSDRQINGTKHTLTVSENLRFLYNDTIPEIYVHVVKRDVHYFNFIESYIHYDPYPEQDFFQAVQVYSNIDGGFGLLTTESRVIDTIDLSQWFQDPDFLERINPTAD